MSTVWRTKHRLHVERCEALVEQLSAVEPLERAVLEEQTVRLLLVVLRLLAQHQVNKHGRCKVCGWTRWGWRVWRRRPRCTVFQTVEHAMGQGLDVVWWGLFGVSGWEVGLEEVRAWVGQNLDVDETAPDEQETAILTIDLTYPPDR